jgi:bacillithiol biosynthesis cysteine-adding enzyme BshC
MQLVCKRHTEIPHTSQLFADLVYHYDRVAGFYPHAPFQPASYEAAARQIDYPSERRARLVAAMRAQNGDGSPALAKLAQEGTVTVLTGQQVGLFSGPAYTLYKALTAVQLARQLSEQQGIPAVPVFWLATEDHDLAEVSTCWSFTTQHEPVRLETAHAAVSDRPVGGIPMESLPLDKLTESLAGFPFADEIDARIRRAYQPGRTYGEAFSAFLRELLEPYGLLFFDPMHPASRALGAEFIAKAVDAAPDLTEQLLDRNKRLNDAGYHAQIHIERHTSLFFLLEDGHRITLRRRNGEYVGAKDRRISPEELKDKAHQISPNAALRPVLQDFMMPTVAYIGGPAELAYLAQSAVIYQTLLGRMPVAVPRNAFTLVDERSAKLMGRYQLQIDAFFNGEEPLRETIAARLTPPELVGTFGETEAAIRANLARLRQQVESFDHTLAAALDKGASKIQHQLSKMQLKVARESLRRDHRAQQDARFLYNTIYPHKHLQERFYTILPFLARHGTDLVARLHDNVHCDCPDHHILFV